METADTPPGCLIVLVRLSADMAAGVPTAAYGDIPAFVAARTLADELVEALVNAADQYPLDPLDVAVLGYRADESGTPQLLPLLSGTSATQLVPLAQIGQRSAEPRGEGLPRKWVALPPCAGEPCAAAALAKVHQLAAVWLTGRYFARPPVVVHCTAPDGLDDDYFRVARSVRLLACGYGPARLMHCVFTADEAVPVGLYTDPPDADPLREVFELSCELPADEAAGKPARRGLSVNHWDITDQWSAVFEANWLADSTAWAGSGGFSHSRAMWAQKMGNSPDQWEDAYAIDAPGGVAAIADGASSGIYCNIWAEQLSARFLTDRPDTRDVASLNKWVNGLRSEWRSAIKYSSLNWSKQAKVDQVGAAATLLVLEAGPADESGARPWRAAAVGDACLFWVRDGRLVATFPVVAADQFGSAPLLVRSNAGFKTLAVAASGTCRPGDRFVLATDAVAARLFKDAAESGVDWDRYEHISQDAWRAELDSLRSANDMVNDDCTLVVLRVAGDAPPAPAEDAAVVVADTDDVPMAEAVPEEEAPPAPEEHGASAPSPAGEAAAEASPPPAEDPPAARDGLPENTDTRD